DPEGGALSAQQVMGPAHASSFTLNGDGAFTYTPVADFNGSDSFSYRDSDGQTTGNTVTVTNTITAVNDAPSFSKGANQTVAEDEIGRASCREGALMAGDAVSLSLEGATVGITAGC